MPPILNRLRKRTSERIDRAAAGSPHPAGAEPPSTESAARPSARERGVMRRRLRKLARLRQAMLLDLGAISFEMHRQAKHDPSLIERKAQQALALDAEARALADALDRELPLSDVVASGIAGTCASCEAIVASDARYCSACGTPVGETPAPSHDDATPAETAAPEQANGQHGSGVQAPVPRASEL